MFRVALEERLKTWQRTAEYWNQVEKVGDFDAYVAGNTLIVWKKFVDLIEVQLK